MSYWLRKRDGTRSYGFRNPDGSWVEMPEQENQPIAASAPVPQIATQTAQPSAPGSIRQFLREIGQRGGKARAARHSREELSKWGRVRRKNNGAR